MLIYFAVFNIASQIKYNSNKQISVPIVINFSILLTLGYGPFERVFKFTDDY